MRKRPNDVEKLDQISQSINPDGKGNLTVGKDLGVDGKLKLKSLVSASNPDGDITKELGGGGATNKLYQHSIFLYDNYNAIYLVLYSYVSDAFNLSSLKSRLTNNVSCSGNIKVDSTYYDVKAINYQSNKFNVAYTIPSSGSATISVDRFSIIDRPSPVE